MADTIKSRLELEGEKEYKAALNSAYRELRVLRSELKAETAELGRNASEQDKVKTKIRSLQDQIKAQEKIVSTLTKAFKDSQAEYKDNAEIQDKWEEKLNKARAALAEMKNQLEDSEDALKGFTDSMGDVAAGSETAVQTVVSFNDCLKSIGSIVSGAGDALSGIFTSTVDTMREMVDEMYQLMGQAYAAAGNWKDIQAMYGGNVEEIQAIFRGAGIMGVDTGTITAGIEKLVQNTHSGNADTAAALDALHIEEERYSNHWDYFIAVMEQLAMREDADELVSKIFGDKKGFGINLLLDQWKEIKDAYQQDIEETGLDLNAEEIEALDEVGKKIQEIQGLWNEVKTSVGAKLSEVLNMDKISDDTLQLLRDVGAIFSADGDRKELIMKLDADISTLLTDISEGLDNFGTFLQELGGDLKQSENPLVAFVGQLIESLGGLIDWIGENADTIIAWLNKLLPIMGANTASEALTGMGLGEWISGIFSTILDFVAISKLGAGFGSAASGELTKGAAGMGSAIGAAIIKAVPALATLGTGITTAGLTLGMTLLGAGLTKEAYDYSQEHPELSKYNREHVQSAVYTDDERAMLEEWISAQNRWREIENDYFNTGADTEAYDLELAELAQRIEALSKVVGTNLYAKYWGYVENSQYSDQMMLPKLEDVLGDVSEAVEDLATKTGEQKALPTVDATDLMGWKDPIKLLGEELAGQRENAPEFTAAMREAAEEWWDAFRMDPTGDWDAQWNAMAGAMGGEESDLFNVFDRMMDSLITDLDTYNKGYDEDIPLWFWSVENILRNLVKPKDEKGGDEEKPKVETRVTVHSHLYLDSSQIMDVVNEAVTDGLYHFGN